MTTPKIIATNKPWQGKLIAIQQDTLTLGEGKPFVREIAVVDDVVGILVLDDTNRILLIKQYRHAVKTAIWEIPAGRMDVAGEQPHETAIRELREEVDLQAQSMEQLAVFANSVGWTTETTYLFRARGLTPTTSFERVHEEADIEKAWIPPSEAFALIQSGAIADAKTMIAILIALKMQ